MIRFSAALVVVAIGVLIGGVATSSLPLVYVAIGISALALVVLAAGVALKRDELFGDESQSAPSGAHARAGQSAGLQGMASMGASSSGTLGSAATLGPLGTQRSDQAGSHVPAAAGAGSYGSAFTRAEASPLAHPARPGAWPPPEHGFPASPAADDGTPSLFKPRRSRRPPEPPTRADPVVPWASTLPTRVDIGHSGTGQAAEPVPSWLEDVDDEPASRKPLARPDDAPDTAVLKALLPDASATPAPADADEATEPAVKTELFDTEPSDVESAPVESIAAEPGAAAELIAAEPAVDERADAEPTADESSDVEPLEAEPAGAEAAGVEPAKGVTHEVAVVPGVPRYHEPDCILVRFMDADDLQRMPVSEAAQAGCTPCVACQSED